MNIITLDFETYWDASYSLSKMSPLEYVLGAEFEVISCAIKLNALPTQVFFGEDAVRAEFERLDIKNSALLGHNMLGFDSYIAAYRFGQWLGRSTLRGLGWGWPNSLSSTS